jgi:hypothetical protein
MPAGRPPKFKTASEMQKAIDAYFESCWGLDRDGNKIQLRPYTVTGLANSIGMERKTLLDYQERDEFSSTIKEAKKKVAQYVEEYLFMGKNQTGAIFNLKNNFDWKDKTETDLTSNGETLNIYLPKRD